MPDEQFRSEFLKCVPRLLKNHIFKTKVIEALGEKGPEIVARVRKGAALDTEDKDYLLDAAEEAYEELAEEVFSLAWDGDAPGMSGVIVVNGCEGIYVIQDDFGPDGPYKSLNDLLRADCLNVVTANPELQSDTLPEKMLLKIARHVVGWDNEGEVYVNGEKYTVSGRRLIPEQEGE